MLSNVFFTSRTLKSYVITVLKTGLLTMLVKSIGNTNINTLAKNYCNTNTNTFTGNTFFYSFSNHSAFMKGPSWLRFFSFGGVVVNLNYSALRFFMPHIFHLRLIKGY